LVVMTVTPFSGDPSGVMGGVAVLFPDRPKRLKEGCLLEESSERELAALLDFAKMAGFFGVSRLSEAPLVAAPFRT
jgi:hypothetical protein